MPAASNRPSRDYRQHHPVETPRIAEREFRPAWRPHGHLDELAARGAIDPVQYRAGLAFRDNWERAFANYGAC